MPSRLLTLLAAVLAGTLLLAGCGGAEEDDPSPTPTVTDDASPDASPDATATDDVSPAPTDTASPDATETTTEATETPTDGGTDVAVEPGDDGTPADGTAPPAQGTPDEPRPSPTAFAPVGPGEDDPCMLSEARVAEITGQQFSLLGPTGSPSFRMCTYGEPADPFSVDLALVDLAAASEESGEEIDGELYISDIRDGAGDSGEVRDLDALGDGSAVLVTDPFGSQAWAYVGDMVYGAYSSGLDDDARYAEELLQAVLAGVAGG